MDFNKFKKVKGKYNALFTIMIFDMSFEEFINDIKRRLKLIQNMKNKFKKKLINDRLFDFIEFIRKNEIKINKLQHVFLIGKKINILKITKKNLKLLKEFNVKNYYYSYDDIFDINYLDDLFNNWELYNVVCVDKNHLEFKKMNKYKYKMIKKGKHHTENELKELLNSLNENTGIIYGSDSILKKFEFNKWDIVNKNLSKDDILNHFNNKKMQLKHSKLSDIFSKIKHPTECDLVLFGTIEDDIKRAIEAYVVKELYCHEKILENFYKHISTDFINFPIYKIDKLKNGDISDELLNDYGGIIGLLYYVTNY